MKRTTILLLIPLTLLLLGAAAFLLLDFRVQQADMGVKSSLSTYSFGENEARLTPQARPLDLYVRAPAMLQDDLIEILQEELAANPYVGQITLHETSPAPAADTVLVLTMEDSPQSFFWTPVYARSALTVDLAYASDGEVAWIGEDVVSITSDDQQPDARVVRARGEYAFDNRTVGLLSRPGYRHYLAGEIARTVNEALAGTLDQQGALSRR